MKAKLITVPLDFEINPDLIAEGITQSEMQTFDNCSEKWYLKYNLLLEKAGTYSWALIVGSAVHAGLEEFYATKGRSYSWNMKIPKGLIVDQAFLQQEQYWNAIGPVMLEEYAIQYKGDFEIFQFKSKDIETVVDIEWRGFRLKGMIDLRLFNKAQKGWFIMDHKTASRFDAALLKGWDFRFQFMFYVWLARKQWPDEKIKGWIVNGVKKPELRQGKESIETFANRVAQDMRHDPDKYFYRDMMLIPKGTVERFENEILYPKLARFAMLQSTKTDTATKTAFLRNKNTDHCIAYHRPCEFLPMCQHGAEIEKFNYTRRENKHQELIETE